MICHVSTGIRKLRTSVTKTYHDSGFEGRFGIENHMWKKYSPFDVERYILNVDIKLTYRFIAVLYNCM